MLTSASSSATEHDSVHHDRPTARDIITTRNDLAWLSQYAPALAAARRPGSHRPWRPKGTKPAQPPQDNPIAVLRAHGGLHASPAPLHVDLLDLAVSLLIDSVQMAELVNRELDLPDQPRPVSHYGDPRPYLDHTHRWISSVTTGTHHWIAGTAAHHTRTIAAALGLITDGQRLAALCPWCGGKDDHHPTGGGHTLVVRLMAHMRDTHGNPIPAVICYGHCDPPQADCGTRWHGHPAWPDTEWAWLAKRLQPGGLDTHTQAS